MTAASFSLSASDGVPVVVHVWQPETVPSGVILVSHGMAEYAMRYERFAAAATARGYAVYAPDHRGHGETARSLSNLGYLADGDGFTRVMEDLRELALEIGRRHPGLPIVLFGHSFGSFVAQLFIETHGGLLKGCALSGTKGPDPVVTAAGFIVSSVMAALFGRKKTSPFLTSLSFGSNNNRIQNPESPSSWLSRDTSEVEKYDASPWAGFMCTTGFYRDLTLGLLKIHRKRMIAAIPRELPVFFVCGSDDPVGKYAKTVRRLASLYSEAGVQDVALKVYDGARHELLNEINREEVTADLLDWISSCR